MVDHRTFVAWTPNPWDGDRHGKDVLELLVRHGLKPSHRLLDFGCGSLRVGRWLIEYLDADKYMGIDPEKWLIEAAKEHEVPAEVWEAKRPRFDYNAEWILNVFGFSFDYVVVSDIAVHAAHWHINKIIQGMASVLAPEGIGLVNIIIPDESTPCREHYTGDKWQYPEGASPVFTAAHYADCLTVPAAANGLKCEAVDVVNRGPCPLHWFKFMQEA